MIPQKPSYYCRRAPAGLTIEGRIAGTVWERATWIREAFHLLGRPSEQSRYFLEAATLWDEEALYVTFVSDPAPVPVTKTRRDDDLFNECTVEVFLRAGVGYYEIEVNPLGTVLDLHFPDAADENWEDYARFDVPGMEWVVEAVGDAGQWCTQIAIPWAGLPELTRTEHEGAVCLLANLARSQKLPDGTYDLTTWGTAQEKFCELEQMGRLILTEKTISRGT